MAAAAAAVAVPGAAAPAGATAQVGSGPGGSNGTGGSADVDAAVPPGPPETTKIKIIVEPGDYGAALLAAMNAATTSIHMTMYLLTSSNVQDALIKAKKRGVQVKVVLNQTFPPNTTSDNTSAYNTLTSAGIGVVWASSVFNYTHAKTVLIDSSQVWIMTMNATTSAPTYNREYLAVDTDPADVAEAEAIFAADYAKTSYAPSGKLVVAPDNARVILNEFIATAASSLDVEAEALSDSDIRDDLANKCASGVKVRVVIAQDDSPSASQTAALNAIKTAGCPVVVTSDPYIHAKTIVVDGVRAYVGSENFTTNSLTYNRELGVLVNNPTEVAKIVNVFNTDYANGTAQ